MDIVAADDAGVWILVDVAMKYAVCREASRLAHAAGNDGSAGWREEGVKRSKYSMAPGLVPFVFETGGRVSTSALALVRRLAPVDETRSPCMADLWQTLSVCLQKHNALMVLHATGR